MNAPNTQNVEVPVPEEAVERSAKARYERDRLEHVARTGGHDRMGAWDDAPPDSELLRTYRKQAAPDLQAAAPYIAAKAIEQERGRLQRVLKANAIWFIRNPGVGQFTLVTDRNEAKDWLDLDPEVIEAVRAGPREISALLSNFDTKGTSANIDRFKTRLETLKTNIMWASKEKLIDEMLAELRGDW